MAANISPEAATFYDPWNAKLEELAVDDLHWLLKNRSRSLHAVKLAGSKSLAGSKAASSEEQLGTSGLFDAAGYLALYANPFRKRF